MKNILHTSRQALKKALIIAAAFAGLQSSHSADLFWDANGASGGTGGTGNWNTADSTWRAGSSSGTLQAWADSNRAVLGGTAGTLTLTQNITVGDSAGGINPTTTGYIIDADGTEELTFLNPDTNAWAMVVLQSSNVLTINANVSLETVTAATARTFWIRGSTTFNGVVSTGGVAHALEVWDSGRVLTLNNGANSFDAPVSVAGGATLAIGHNTALGSATLRWLNNGIIAAGGGDRVLSNAISFGNWNHLHRMSGDNDLRFSSHQILQSGASGRSTLDVINAAAVLRFDSLATSAGQAGGFIKAGLGTLSIGNFTNANNTNTISVNAGTLLITGTFQSANIEVANNASLVVDGTVNLAATRSVSVATGGTLSGVGTISGGSGVSVSGTLSPGNSIGVLSMENLSLNNNSTFLYEVDSSVAPSDGADLVIADGGLTFTGTVTLALDNLDLSPEPFALGTTFTLINYSGVWNGGFLTYNSTSLANLSTFEFNSQLWRIEYNATSGGSNFAWEYLAGSSFVNMTVIPEPGTAALLLPAFGAFLWLRKRQQKIEA